jgi:DNA repair exonuclease SbcCD ATPase subunit
MYLKTIGARNFLGYKKLDLDVEPGLWLIDGINHHYATSSSNGSGKSTLQEAIAFPTFGETLRPLLMDEVIREGSNYAETWNTFVRANGQELRIERYRKHPKLGNRVRMLLDGKDQGEGRYTGNTDDRISKAIGFDFEIFKRAVIIHSRITEGFVSVKDRYLKQITEKLIGLPDFDPLLKRTKDAARGVEDAIHSLEYRVQCEEDQLEQHRRSIIRFRRALADQVSKDKSDKLASDERVSIGLALKQKAKWFGKMTESTKQLAKAERRLAKASKDSYKATAERSKFYQREIIVKRARMELIAKQKGKYRDLKDSKCPECGQTVSKEHIRAKMLALDKEYAELVTAVALADVTHSRNQKAEAEAEDKAAAVEKDCQLHKDRTYGYREKFNACKHEIESHKKVLALHERQAEQNVSPYRKLIKETKKKLTLTKWKIADLEASVRKKEKRLLYYNYWKRGFGPSGIRSYILDAVIPVINNNANAYLDVLTDGQMTVNLSTVTPKKDGELSDRFDISVENLSGSSKLAGNSDGELGTVDLAVNFAMSDILESRITDGFGFMFIDQAIDLLDTARGRKAIQLLNQKLNPEWCKQHNVPVKRTIFLITHREALKGLVENRIIVEKRGGICRLVSQ